MSQSNELSGTVRNAARCEPMPGVSVAALAGDDTLLAETVADATGAWALNVPAETQRICFQGKGQEPKCFVPREVPAMVRLINDGLVAYQERLWFVPGERVDVFVHSTRAYRATLVRHGLNREEIVEMGDHSPIHQTVPDRFFVDTGLEWQPAFSYRIPTDAQPGLYSVALRSDDAGFVVPFIVSTPPTQRGKDARLLVLASTNTWQSYNLWGGRSRYRNFETAHSREFLRPARWKDIVRKCIPARLLRVVEKLVHEPAWKFERLSIRRPFPLSGLDQASPEEPFTNHLAGGEWRVLAWLEREGISYDIVSGVEFHRNPALLGAYQSLLLNTHCEYWTREMYEGLEHWHRHQGGWIVNVGANAIFREIEAFGDGSTRCVSLAFLRSCADESQITGVRFTAEDYGTCAPYKVTAPNHWVFENASLAADGVFGKISLNRNLAEDGRHYAPHQPGIAGGLKGSGASGWEMDKLTHTAPPDITRVAKGMNPHGGADMVMREPNGSRGGMFSASAITFGGALLIDNIVSGVLRNVITRAVEGSSA